MSPGNRNDAPFWRREAGKYYGRYTDEHGRRRRAALYEDYEKSVIRLQGIRNRVELIVQGVAKRSDFDVADAGDKKIADLLEQFCKTLDDTRLTANYVREFRVTINAYSDACGVKRLKQATRGSLERYLAKVSGKGRSAETRNKAKARLNTFFEWCVERKYLAENPASRIKRVSDDGGKDKPRALTHDELRALIVATKNDKRRLAYLFCSRAGLRVYEAHRLTWHHIDMDGGWIRLTRTITKEKRDADLPMDGAIRAELLRMKQRVRGSILGNVPSRYTWLRDLVRAGIVTKADLGMPSGNWSESDLVGYRDDRGRVLSRRCLRKTFGTHLAAAGATPQTIAKLMRHRDPALTLQYYTDPRLLDLRGAVEKLPGFESDAKEQAG